MAPFCRKISEIYEGNNKKHRISAIQAFVLYACPLSPKIPLLVILFVGNLYVRLVTVGSGCSFFGFLVIFHQRLYLWGNKTEQMRAS